MTILREIPREGEPYPRAQPPQQPVAPAPPSGADVGAAAYSRPARPGLRLALLVLGLAGAALIVWLVFLRPGGESQAAQPGGGPVGTSQADLAALSVRLGQPVYWAGTRPETELEATVTANQYVYVRYLTSGARVGDSQAKFLTVATYPAADALANLRSYANHGKAEITRIRGGGIAVPVPGSPTSVYVASPRSDYQVEVFDPKEGEALNLIRSGRIVPVPGGVDASGRPAG